MWFGACSSGGPTKTTSRSGDTMHCHAAAQQTLVILSPTLPKLCDMNSHFICLSLCHFSCIYQRGSSSTAFSTSARQRLARMSRGVHFSTWSQQAHGSLQPTVQNYHGSSPICDGIIHASVEPFLYAEQHCWWGVSGLGDRPISDGSH